MGSASFPSLHLPTFFAKAHTQERLTRNRLVVRLYASVNFSVNESRDGSVRTASGLPTTQTAGRPHNTSAFFSTYSATVVGIPSGLPVIRPRFDAKRGDHSLQADLPGLNAPGVRFVIGSLPLTDGARPSRDVKTIVARSADGRIQNYSRGGHHDSNQCYTTRQRAGRCNSSV